MPSEANTRDATDAQAALDRAFADLEHQKKMPKFTPPFVYARHAVQYLQPPFNMALQP
jgi:hypothetical protein